MALIAIGGDSGRGKSTSMRNLDPATTYLIQTIPKPLPFPKWKTKYPLMDKKTWKGNRYVVFSSEFDEKKTNKEEFHNASNRVTNLLRLIPEKKPEIKTIIIDDSQYIMSFEYMARGKEVGFNKFSELAQNFFSIIRQASAISENINIVFLHHTEIANDIEKLKTSGKMIDNHITLEGLFTIVLLAKIVKENGKAKYKFITHSDGTNTVKTPMGMFGEDEIDNDLVKVFNTITKYEE